ncbi:hypothetical protein HDU67_002390, partial [Dinochytrium kinnereticum]
MTTPTIPPNGVWRRNATGRPPAGPKKGWGRKPVITQSNNEDPTHEKASTTITSGEKQPAQKQTTTMTNVVTNRPYPHEETHRPADHDAATNSEVEEEPMTMGHLGESSITLISDTDKDPSHTPTPPPLPLPTPPKILSDFLSIYSGDLAVSIDWFLAGVNVDLSEKRQDSMMMLGFNKIFPVVESGERVGGDTGGWMPRRVKALETKGSRRRRTVSGSAVD